MLVLGCDSVLEVDGVAYGKPGSAAVATERLRRLREQTAVLHTGHHLTDLRSGSQSGAVASTSVTFGSFSDEEIAAYVACGEPLQVAGAFTIDGLGGAFVDRVDGDPHNVVGLSLPLLRRMVGDLGIGWHEMWNRAQLGSFESGAG
jgi:septum formation protein